MASGEGWGGQGRCTHTHGLGSRENRSTCSDTLIWSTLIFRIQHMHQSHLISKYKHCKQKPEPLDHRQANKLLHTSVRAPFENDLRREKPSTSVAKELRLFFIRSAFIHIYIVHERRVTQEWTYKPDFTEWLTFIEEAIWLTLLQKK